MKNNIFSRFVAFCGGERATIFLFLAIALIIPSYFFKSEALRIKDQWAKTNTALIVANNRLMMAKSKIAELEKRACPSDSTSPVATDAAVKPTP